MKDDGLDGRLRLATMMLFVAAVAIAGPVDALAKTKIKQTLTPTVHAPGASGAARLLLRTPTTGKFTIKARRLPGGKTFDVVVNKVKVGTLTTSPGGSGTLKFSNPPVGRASTLGFDPRGAQIAVRDDETGDDDLDTDMPDDNPDSAIGCCIGAECEDETATECSEHGGTPTASAGCLPDPCNGNPPPATVVCCRTTSAGGAFVDDDPETECDDDVSSAECAAHGGMVVQASSCDPNPCQPTPPPDLVICCVPDGDHAECEHITSGECTAEGGTVNGAASCDSDPCGGGAGGGD